MKKILALLLLSLVIGAASSPALAAEAPYTVIAGDVLQITVWKEDGMDREVLVLPDGSITFPLVGTVQAQGQTLSQVQDTVKKKLKKLIPDASVTVTVKAALGHSVNVIGQVAKPGEFVISHSMTAMQALSQAGGLTPYASEGDIIILRHENGKEISIELPYDDIASGDDLEKDITLNPGDVIVVPTSHLF